MELEVRRVQKTGSSTMTVSLPKDWVESSSIKPGDPVAVKVMPDGTVCIDPRMTQDKADNKKVLWVDADEQKEHLTRKLIGAYLAGYNIIEVRSKDRLDLDLKHAVKDISRMLIGPEVIEETSNTVILHDLSDPVELPQEKCVRRMHLIVTSMHRDAMLALEQLDEAMAKDVMDRDADVDRLYWMAVKQYNLIMTDRRLSERIGVDIYGGMTFMLVARGIERIGDHAEKIARNVLQAIETKAKLGNVHDVGDLSARSLSVLDRSMEAFFRRDVAGANIVIDEAEKLVQELQDRTVGMRLPTNLAAVTMTSVLDSILRTTMYATDICEIAINAAMREETA